MTTMRTDVTIDGRQVPCPNASLLAFGRGAARPGDLISYDEEHCADLGANCGSHRHSIQQRTARVLGRVTASDLPAPRILVLALSDCSTFAYERWVEPARVRRVQRMTDGDRDVAAFAALFFARKLPGDANEMRRLADHGTLSASHVGRVAERLAEWRAADAAMKEKEER